MGWIAYYSALVLVLEEKATVDAGKREEVRADLEVHRVLLRAMAEKSYLVGMIAANLDAIVEKGLVGDGFGDVGGVMGPGLVA